ncbi:hypothetical protein L2E82_26423 [Cichorium intybus]|uniref:Uncharacterized protein n=1 Tax=Cichorium intybus TaxID=13427 RepID=A0ACB9CQQ5_CICIN|nr:hypothetical protein L2E82_26423 [Cichorium intybus]
MSSAISRCSGANPTSSSKPIDQSFFFNPLTKTPFLKSNKSAWNLHGRSCRSLQYLSMSMNLQRPTLLRQSNINPPPEAPLPSGSPSGSLRNWIVGLVLTFILPFFTHKWGSWLLLKNQVDQKIEATEHVVKAVESVADKLDKVIDGITDDLPDGSKLKKALEFVDEIAEGVAKTAHVADDFINKQVEETEDKLESLIHRENSKVEEISQQPNDKEDHEVTAQEQNDKK